VNSLIVERGEEEDEDVRLSCSDRDWYQGSKP
jgi:hypothetical protein